MLTVDIRTPLSLEETILAGAVGVVAFPSILGLTQVAIFRPLRLTNSLHFPAASVLGGLAVCAAGALSSMAVVRSCSLLQQLAGDRLGPTDRSTTAFTLQDTVTSSALSAVVFRALGGRFSSALPSHILRPGAFGHEWIPAKGTQYATTWEKDWIQQLGKKYGCHTCGRKGVLKFSADHQPPSKLVSNGNGDPGVQKFYPQCDTCSGLQGGVISNGAKDGGKRAIVAHPLSLRLYHLFLSPPLLLLQLRQSTLQRPVPVPSVPSVERSRITEGETLVVEKEGGARGKAQEQSQGETSRGTRENTAEAERESSEAVAPAKRFSRTLLFDVTDCPLLIIWRRLVYFLDSFASPFDRFHITLWLFAVIAAFGTI